MNRKLPAFLAVLLLLTMSACQNTPPASTAETATATQTQTAATEPETTASETQTEPQTVPAGGADVTDQVNEGSIEESVSYRLSVPKVAAGDEAAGQTISDYYASVSGKLGDLASGEVYEEADESHSVINFSSAYEVEYNQGGILSILRSVSVFNQTSGADQTTWYAETFNLQNGGLYTLDDFFSVPEDEYTTRLVQAVQTQISDDPYHSSKYFDQWKDLAQSAFDKKQFYFTGDTLVVFYQENALGSGISSFFPIPVSDLQDILKVPQ